MRGSTQIKQNEKHHPAITGDFSDAPGEQANIR